MKCIRILDNNNPSLKNVINTILKVDDRAAKKFVDANEAEYVPRSAWKKQENKLNTPT